MWRCHQRAFGRSTRAGGHMRKSLLSPSSFLFAVLAAVAAGCGSGPAALAPHDAAVESPTGSDAPVAPVSKPVGPAGGAVSGPGGAEVTIPAGALTTETSIGVAMTGAADGAVPSLPARVQVAGDRFALLPHGTTFAAPVT